MFFNLMPFKIVKRQKKVVTFKMYNLTHNLHGNSNVFPHFKKPKDKSLDNGNNNYIAWICV